MKRLLFLAGAIALSAQTVPADWVRRAAIPIADVDTARDLSDLGPLKALIGDARIVALGEGTHGTHEFFAMKRRLTEFLAREMGFTIFAMEANLPEAAAIDDFTRTGAGDAAALVKGLQMWPWTTEELTELVRWMRTYRAGGGAMSFNGVDVQLPAAAQQIVTDFLAAADPDLAARAAATYARLTPPDRQFGLAYLTLPAAEFAGRRVTMHARVKVEGVTARYAGLHLRADDGRGESLLRVNSQGAQMATGTADWRTIDLTIDVPAGTASLRAGLVLFGTGTAWFDDVEVRVDGGAAPLQQLAFDAGAIAPLVIDERSRAMPFAIGRDEALNAVRVAFTGTPLTGAAAATAARAIADELRARERALATRLPADRVAWAVHNADFVAQSFDWRADATGLAREVAMAKNIKWLLDRAPANAKVVVWAHNGHVSRQGIALGAQLEKLYPGQMVNVGFTTSSGRYRAETPSGATAEFDLTPPPAGSVEEALAASGQPRFLLDLRAATRGDAGAAWLNVPRPFRFIGITGTDNQFRQRVLPREFDLLIYFERTRASVLLK